MGATHRKKKSKNGKSKHDFSKAGTASSAPSSSIDEMDSSEDGQTEGDDVQLPSTNHPNPEHEKQPAYPKKPPTSYNFYIKDKRDKIVRNNPGLNSMEIASISGKMFKALSEEKKQKYVELARIAKENYQKQVQEFKEAYPDPEPVETSEKMESPLAPTPFSIFRSRKKNYSISWCKTKFASLSNKQRLNYIDLALAQEVNYLAEFEKFKAENPFLQPKLIPVLNEEEKLLVFMRDAKPVKPPSTSFYLFASEYHFIPSNEDENQTRMAQVNASWNALSEAEKRVYQKRVITMKNEYTTKLSAYLSKLPAEKRRQEIAKCLPNAKGIKRKRGAEADASASAKKLKPALGDEYESESSEEKEPPMDISGSKSSPITVDSSDEPEDNVDVALLKKKQISSPQSTEESSEEFEASDSEPEQSIPPKIQVELHAFEMCQVWIVEQNQEEEEQETGNLESQNPGRIL